MLDIKDKKEQEHEKLQLMLAGPEKEFLDFGKKLGPKSKLIQRENELGQFLEKKDVAAQYGTTVLNEEQIIEEISKYNLMFMRMDQYAGDFDVDFLRKVKAFIAEKEIQINDHDLSRCCFALYPKKSYYLLGEGDTNNDKFYNGSDEKNPSILFREARAGINYYHVIHQGTPYRNLFNFQRGLLYGDWSWLWRTLIVIIGFLVGGYTIGSFAYWYVIAPSILFMIWNVIRMYAVYGGEESTLGQRQHTSLQIKNTRWE